MARRLRPALALASVLVVPALLAGCSATNPVTTAMNYDASDGVSASVGDVRLLNLLVASNGDGEPGAVLGAVSNEGEDARVAIAVAGGEPQAFPVDAGQVVLLGSAATGGEEGAAGGQTTEEVELEAVDVPAGALLELEITTDLGGTRTVSVPVVDGSLPPYEDLVPGGGDADTEG